MVEVACYIDHLSHSGYIVFFADIISRNELRYILIHFFPLCLQSCFFVSLQQDSEMIIPRVP